MVCSTTKMELKDKKSPHQEFDSISDKESTVDVEKATEKKNGEEAKKMSHLKPNGSRPGPDQTTRYTDVKDLEKDEKTDVKVDIAGKYGETDDSNFSDSDGDDTDLPQDGRCATLFRCHKAAGSKVLRHTKTMKGLIKIITAIAYLVYFSYAMYYRFGDEGSFILLIFTSLVVSVSVFGYVRSKTNCKLDIPDKVKDKLSSLHVNWWMYIIMTIFAIVYITIEVGMKNPRNLVSLTGIVVLTGGCFLCSRNIFKINWHCVFWSISSQFIFAIILLKTTWGLNSLVWMGSMIEKFMENGYAASAFVFGESYGEHRIILQSLPLVFLVSAFIELLYYVGLMQVLIKAIGSFLKTTLKTTPPESLSVSANIFLGSTQTILLVKPYLSRMSRSELFALIVGGFSSVSGLVMGIYIGFGAPTQHLLAASLMSAPAAFAVAKLLVPETKARSWETTELTLRKYSNMVEAVCRGALEGVIIYMTVAVTLYTFSALLTLVNSLLVWFGERVGVQDFTFQFITSYLFFPIAFIMGIEPADCRAIGKLIGYKLTGTNGLAFIELGELIENRKTFLLYESEANNTWHYNNDDIILDNWNRTLVGGYVTDRSSAIATYAMSGFSNLMSMGVMLATLVTLIPQKQRVLAPLVMKAMVAGNVACYLTACIAGLFYST